MKTFISFLIGEESTKTPVSVLLGRFNPPHLGHIKMVKMMKYKPVILIVEGKKSSDDKTRNPLSGQERAEMIKKIIPNADVRVVYSANFSPILFHLQKDGKYIVKEIMAGADRVDSYKKMVEKTEWKDINVVLTPRVTSATKVRESIRNGDEETFKKLMPRVLWNEWEMMREKIADT
jgi:cytidyltransferase-like protein